MSGLFIVVGALLVYMTLLFAISTIVKNNGIADIGYGIGFIVCVLAAVGVNSVQSWQLALLSSLPFVWGLRLAIRIAYKNIGKPEDFRYRAWRDAWGSTFWIRSFLQIYMLQGLVILLVGLPITLSILFPSPDVHMIYFAVGICLWVIGFIFEVVGDQQLDAFIHNPLNKGKIMMSGLWRYSRHPNYFGESLMWWGIAVAASSSIAYPMLVWISPILITFLLLKVSGVPLLEKRWEGNPEWEEYKRKTSVFIPLPPTVN